jgi:hypothetical protein
LCCLILIVGGTYLSCFHSFRLTFEHEGWTLEFLFRPFRCLHCTGRIEKLRYRGKPLQLPRPPGRDVFDGLYVQTPVGSFEWYGSAGWLAIMSPGRHTPTPTLPPLTEEDLAHGYYDILLSEHEGDAARSGRHGTPPHWYSLSSRDIVRWIDPERMEDVTDWPTTQPIAATEPVAPRLAPVEHSQP